MICSRSQLSHSQMPSTCRNLNESKIHLSRHPLRPLAFLLILLLPLLLILFPMSFETRYSPTAMLNLSSYLNHLRQRSLNRSLNRLLVHLLSKRLLQLLTNSTPCSKVTTPSQYQKKKLQLWRYHGM